MNKYLETTLYKLEDIFSLNKFFLSPFVFRGQSDSNWKLKTAIERLKEEYKSYATDTDYRTIEKWTLYEFTRKFHLYSNLKLALNEKFEWLSTMQHYGAPTRLLDFSDSIFIALYFAIIESSGESSVWAINKHTLRDNLFREYKLLYKKGEALKDEINRAHIDFANIQIAKPYSSTETLPTTVIPLDPILCSDRISKQQGLFLMPTNPKESFMKNLECAFSRTDSNFDEINFEELIKSSSQKEFRDDIQIIKINIPQDNSNDIIRYLFQMNITAEVLFPGLEGLAKSLVQTQVMDNNMKTLSNVFANL